METTLPSFTECYPDATFSDFCPPSRFVATMRQYGVVAFPGVIKDSQLDAIREEYTAILAEEDSPGNKQSRQLDFLVMRILTLEHCSAYPHSHSFFSQPVFQIYAEQFQDEKTVLNYQIFVNETKGFDTAREDYAFRLHADRIQTLKFFLYLDDIGEKDGSLVVAPDQYRQCRQRRIDAMASGTHWEDMPSRVPEKDANMVSLNLPKGSIIAFDSDLPHKAGWVRPGHQRRIMRGHSRGQSILDWLAKG